ncbi:MAG: PAS domain S-box protein [Smithella sp.]
MNDQSKTKHELIQELVSLRKRIAELSQYESEQKKAEESLREEENKYKSLIESIPDIIFITIDLEGKITFISKRIKEILGYENEEMISRNIFNFISEEDHQRAMETLQKGMKGEKIKHVQLPVTAKSGEKLFFDFSFSRIYKDGVVVGAQGTAVDVTERRMAEELLKQSEAKYRLLADHMQDYVWLMDLNLQWTYISPSGEKLLGYTLKELQQLPLDKLLTATSYQMAMDIFSSVVPNALAQTLSPSFKTLLEIECRCKDDRTLWIESTFSFIWDDNGKPLSILGEGKDITGRKKIEDMLRKSELNYRQLFDNAPAAIYQIDFRTGKFLKANDLICEYFDCSQEEITLISPYDSLTKESQKLFLERLSKMAIGDKVPEDPEYEFVDKNGKIRWLKLNSKNIYDAEGHVIAADVVAHDITERKRVEDALRKSEERYRTILEDIKEGYFEVDFAGNFTFFNDSLRRFLGYSKEELMGMNNRQYTDKEHSKILFQTFNKVYNTGEPTEDFEWQVIKKDGTKKYVEASVLLQKDSSGKLIGFRGIVRDITDRRIAEEALKKSEQRYLELSIIDDLTQLYNSRHFYAQIEREIERSNRYEQPLTLLMLDLDKFKEFNDTYGHVEGDYVLSQLGQVIKRCLRETDSAYRYGGEEFTIILPMTTSDEGFVAAQRIQAELRKEAFSRVSDQNIPMTVSIGLAQYKQKEEMKAFVHRADQLMYQAKKNGRDRICPES